MRRRFHRTIRPLDPELHKYWPDVLRGYDVLSQSLRELDDQGRLRPMLAPFEACEVRAVLRATEVYAEVARMLWHPVSLHEPDQARVRARDLLTRMAANVATAPDDPGVIEAEIDDLLIGDIPYFSTIASHGALTGPSGLQWLPQSNLVDDALQDWRKSDLTLERTYICAALASAYVNDGWTPGISRMWPEDPRSGDLDARRRRQMTPIMRELIETAIVGLDGTTTWIAPTLTQTGWAVQPLDADLYGGLSGIALLAAAYLKETEAGRADPVEGLDQLLKGVLLTLDKIEDKQQEDKTKGKLARPPCPWRLCGVGLPALGAACARKARLRRRAGSGETAGARHSAGGRRRSGRRAALRIGRRHPASAGACARRPARTNSCKSHEISAMRCATTPQSRTATPSGKKIIVRTG